MYNLLHGMNPLAAVWLTYLDLTAASFGRFRDAFVVDAIRLDEGQVVATGPFVAVYTRCGGGNRQDYQDVFKEMSAHPLYHSDMDDSFDQTYCTFYFRVKPEDVPMMNQFAQTWNPDQAWWDKLKEIEKGNFTQEQRNFFKKLFEQLSKEG